ncbi:snoaL-like domain protein [Mycolicibacterium hassiacum DSM 44199]|uniref:SnoaL-like domain protein n=1 Tax=Mycolicibacterium hassiacum (strain DSM 44199 / CIP 105218 / JCM 12690 / 3849) TaxID=1122247 RepID=K5BCR0_MYCHD|nr:nuclear transport factor 2 family protein [Mycolicibacterium hassiacum]EKF21727.1 snoaL-like domain protein [Mycolicibacterium hassiacum DSM 44199]MBX5486315.1 nuclear transport factor 2 family protein [Mycolicibacterium hassiacum]MDA4088489.1 polyketide cyclase [Mycolicibacterium hassiacum DSM 44199]PZN24327.1 MAG: nuclear transport factor 2 family protein [Mycolicibacterium hassiacum]
MIALTSPDTPRVVTEWLRFINSGDRALLDELLDESATFYSPAVFTPQQGRDKAAAYLLAAEKMFSGTDFTYVSQWYGERSAVLEFRATLDGIVVEGVDIIHWSDAEKIVDFKVMIRPLKALQTVIPKMAELLAPSGS